MPISLLRYPGGKSRAVNKILPLIPSGTSTLLSPFMGGGSVELAWAKEHPQGKVFACDFFMPVAIFWEMVKTDPARMADVVRDYYPLEKECFYTLQQTHSTEKDPMEIAAQFYVLNRCSFSGSTLSGGMSPNHTRFTESSIRRLEQFGISNFTVEHADMFYWLPSILANADTKDTFIYLDPPYLLSENKLYGNKGDRHKGFSHQRLAQLLSEVSGLGFKWLLSYNDNPTIRSMYQDYHIESVDWTYGMNKSKCSNEIFISNGTE